MRVHGCMSVWVCVWAHVRVFVLCMYASKWVCECMWCMHKGEYVWGFMSVWVCTNVHMWVECMNAYKYVWVCCTSGEVLGWCSGQKPVAIKHWSVLVSPGIIVTIIGVAPSSLCFSSLGWWKHIGRTQRKSTGAWFSLTVSHLKLSFNKCCVKCPHWG
jgi:hypothetical protein